MFWNKKNKLPITKDDKIWIDECLNWLKTEFGEKHFLSLKTITPTKNFYERKFDGTKKDAEFILKKTMKYMCIQNLDINLEYFSEGVVTMDDGSLLTTPGDLNGNWKSAAGTYEKNENGVTITLEIQQLKNPITLIATIAHELSHQILLGENRIIENDEYLTDLTAILYGFGIFIGNSRFSFSQFSSTEGFGWQTNNQGYLPEQIIAYTMAWLSLERNENIDYTKHLKKSLKKYFMQSYKYLKSIEP